MSSYICLFMTGVLVLQVVVVAYIYTITKTKKQRTTTENKHWLENENKLLTLEEFCDDYIEYVQLGRAWLIRMEPSWEFDDSKLKDHKTRIDVIKLFKEMYKENKTLKTRSEWMDVFDSSIAIGI